VGKGLAENFDRHLRGDIARLGSSDAVRDRVQTGSIGAGSIAMNESSFSGRFSLNPRSLTVAEITAKLLSIVIVPAGSQ